ncbi:YfbU family protein [Lysinibacillus sp. JNUCC-51]|uniref:YfbU family protein n=1 Tax=unclassified Lysinibacillus TaxID=2636778 RepID=UPI001935E6F9|nr:YfbU family protein [Lysinibacillus sp. JNUCC-51]
MEDTLSMKDRLMIANQYEILSRLTNDDYEKRQYENLRDIFVSGYSKYYSLATEWFSEEVNPVECKFVVEVLNLYRDLYFSWSRNEEARKIIDEDEVLFKGFDLNDDVEVKYFSFYKFLVEQLDQYSEIKEFMQEGKIEDFNSHGFGPSMNTLKTMIQKHNEIKTSKGFRSSDDLTFEEIKEILNI